MHRIYIYFLAVNCVTCRLAVFCLHVMLVMWYLYKVWNYLLTRFFYFYTVAGRSAATALSHTLYLVDSIWNSLFFWISSPLPGYSPPLPLLVFFFLTLHLPLSQMLTSLLSLPLTTFLFHLIKFHRVGRGSEGGSTHMSNHSCYFSGTALSWAAKPPPA